jgi:dTMP kinase
MFVVFEGADGSGKTTACSILKQLIQNKTRNTVSSFRAPDGPIREVLLNRQGRMDARTELLLFMANHRWILDNNVNPAIERGEFVLLDRFIDSTICYQGSQDILTCTQVSQSIQKWVEIRHEPNYVIYITADEDVAEKRIASRGNLDFMDQKPVEFRRRVRQQMIKQYEERLMLYVNRRSRTYPIIIDNSDLYESLEDRIEVFFNERIRKM